MKKTSKWRTPPALWDKLRPLAQQMRKKPTVAEEMLWKKLRNRKLSGYKFRRQHCIDRFILDFYCHETRLCVEVDGPVHQYSKEEDKLRKEFLEILEIRVLRFTNEEVMEKLNGVVARISEYIKDNPLSASGEGT